MPKLSELSLSSNIYLKACEFRGLFLWVIFVAGFELSFQHNIKQVQKQLSDIEKKVIPRVVVRSLNKTGVTVNKEAAKRVRLETNLPAKRIKAKFQLNKSRRGLLVWSLKALRGSTNIIEWVPPSKREVGAFRKKPGVTSRAWGKSKSYPGTFIGQGKSSGKLLVYVRDPSKPSGIKAVQGPNVRRSFFRSVDGLKMVAQRRFAVVFDHEMSFALSKIK